MTEDWSLCGAEGWSCHTGVGGKELLPLARSRQVWHACWVFHDCDAMSKAALVQWAWMHPARHLLLQQAQVRELLRSSGQLLLKLDFTARCLKFTLMCIECMLAPTCATWQGQCATYVALLLDTALEPACADVLGGRLLQLDTFARRYSPLDLCLLH